jgi:2'-5' RNA ligase
MPHAIEIGLAPGDDALVRMMWARLHGVTGSGYMSAQVAFPHVALAVIEPGASTDALTAIVEGWDRVAVRLDLDGWGEFPGVVYWGVRPEPGLLRLHAAVATAVERAGGVIDPHYRPGRWVPHCTLAQTLSADAQAMARRLMASEPAPSSLMGASMALVAFPPATVIHRVAARPG